MVYKREIEFFTPSLAADSKSSSCQIVLDSCCGGEHTLKNTALHADMLSGRG